MRSTQVGEGAGLRGAPFERRASCEGGSSRDISSSDTRNTFGMRAACARHAVQVESACMHASTGACIYSRETAHVSTATRTASCTSVLSDPSLAHR
eukprot:3637439-Pleurochrysis_carterae.AAC.1